MCLNCLNTARPDRGTVCLDEGAYLVNFKACASCGVRAMPRTAKREEQATVDSEDETPVAREEKLVRTRNKLRQARELGAVSL